MVCNDESPIFSSDFIPLSSPPPDAAPISVLPFVCPTGATPPKGDSELGAGSFSTGVSAFCVSFCASLSWGMPDCSSNLSVAGLRACIHGELNRVPSAADSSNCDTLRWPDWIWSARLNAALIPPACATRRTFPTSFCTSGAVVFVQSARASLSADDCSNETSARRPSVVAIVRPARTRFIVLGLPSIRSGTIVETIGCADSCACSTLLLKSEFGARASAAFVCASLAAAPAMN